MIPDGEWIQIGDPVNPAERRALDSLREILEPEADPYAVVSNVRLPNGRGDFYEYDAIVVAPAMIFVLEFKGWSGRIVCQRDRWFMEDGSYFENPSNLISRKAKHLRGLLAGGARSLRDHLWVQDLVYVNGLGAQLTDVDRDRRTTFDVLSTSFDSAAALKSALLKPERWCRPQQFSGTERELIITYLRGGKARVAAERISKYIVEERLVSTSDRFQRLLAHDRYEPRDPATLVEIHAYPIDGRLNETERTAKAFSRQIATLNALGKAGVAAAYVADGESIWNGGNVRYIAYEWLGRYETLGDRLDRAGSVGLRDSLLLGIAVAESLAVMHSQAIIHGALEPAALHVKDEAGIPHVLIGRIEVARPREASVSIDTISSVGASASCYASPSVIGGHHPDETDDLFSFGAILAHLLRGRPLFTSPSEILQQIRLPRLLDDRSADPPELRNLIATLLARDAKDRPASMRDVVVELRESLRLLEGSGRGEEWIGRYRIMRDLRTGATGRTVVAERADLIGEVVLKIAPLGRDETLQREIEYLRGLHHPNIVTAFHGEALTSEGVYVGEFALLKGDDCERLRGNVVGEQIRGLAQGLLAALTYVHEHKLVHRDVKPANVMLGSDGTATLLDFGLACAPDDIDLVIGTAPYKSERLFMRGAWQPSDDVFAAIVTLWETITGKHPWNGTPPQGPPSVEASDLGNLLPPATAEQFGMVVRDLLAAPPEGPNAAEVAWNRIARLVAPPSPVMVLPLGQPEITLPAKLRLDTPTAEVLKLIHASPRARQALDDLGVRTLEDVRTLRVADLAHVKGFGRGIADEVAGFAKAVIARFGEASPPAMTTLRPVDTALEPLLVGDAVAATADIGILRLPPDIAAALSELGIMTIAQLAATETARLEGTPQLGAPGLAALRQALGKYKNDSSGSMLLVALPEWRIATLAELTDNLSRLGVEASRVQTVVDAGGGFMITTDTFLGVRTSVVGASPWSENIALDALRAIEAAAAWPPRELDEIVGVVARRVSEAGLAAFTASHGELSRSIVERLAPCLSDLDRTAEGRWYRRSALDVRRAIEYGTDGLALPTKLAPLLQAIERRLPGFKLPSPGSPEFALAIDAAGFVWQVDGLLYRRDTVPQQKALDASDLTGAEPAALPAAAAALARATGVGGYHLVVAEPGVYHARVRALLESLYGALQDHFRVIDFDAELCRALREAGTLETACRIQAKKGLAPGAIGPLANEAAKRILDGALGENRGVCTVIHNTGSLALTNAVQHLGKIYDQARGGRHGLIVVCVPGDHPRDHARLNRVVPLPQQPTERPIVLEEFA